MDRASDRDDVSVPEKRRKFGPRFKPEAVQLVVTSGRRPVAEVARQLRTNEGILGHWVNSWRRDDPEPESEMSPVGRARPSELEEEVRRLPLENEFLKNAAGLLRPDAGLSQRCALIEAEKTNYGVAWMCPACSACRVRPSTPGAAAPRPQLRPTGGNWPGTCDACSTIPADACFCTCSSKSCHTPTLAQRRKFL